MIQELNDRARQILKLVVDAYVETGAPVGSKAVSERLGMKLSPATIRNAMAELESLGLLYAPHTSAGRLPTETGMSVFVDGLLELDDLSAEERAAIDAQIAAAQGRGTADVFEQASNLLSGLSSCAGLVFSPKSDDDIRQVEFVKLGETRALAVLVAASGMIENRVIDLPAGVDAGALVRAANFINARIGGATLAAVQGDILREISDERGTLDALSARVVGAGIASIAPQEAGGRLFIRGQSKLLDDVSVVEDLQRIRGLLDALEAKENMLKLLRATTDADGVKIFIGAENSLFSHAGCAMIVAPYRNQASRVVGAIGVIGPTRINYGRIIPVVNYTSQIIGRIVG